MRPRQWLKNLLVFAPVVAAGLQLSLGAWLAALICFLAFCSTSSAVYLINDAVDAERDRLHHLKRLRPIASGSLSVRAAVASAGVLLAGGMALGSALNWAVMATLASYAGLHVAYSLALKRVPVIEMLAVAAGFVLRGVSGGFAIDVVVSEWFLLVTASGALLVVTGKRYGESIRHPQGETRAALLNYDQFFLRGLLAMAATTTTLGYVLWSFGIGRLEESSFLDQITAVPFTAAVLLYWNEALGARAEAPDRLLTRNRPMVASILVWGLLYALATLAT